MKNFGFIRVGAVVNKLYLANCHKNALEIVKMIKEASKKSISVVAFPELSITGYTCGDLFLNDNLLDDSIKALDYILENTKSMDIISILGIPIKYENSLFNCAVVIQKGKIMGIVPKTYIPNYSEFYEKRWFTSSINLKNSEIEILGQKSLIGTNIIFKDKINENISFAIEICEDLWAVLPPSNNHCLNGANMIFNLSSSNEIVGKYEYRKNLVKMQSSKTISAYIYASSGMMESSSDLLFSGSSMIYENGSKLCENERFQINSSLIYTDIDVNRLNNERRKNISYMNIKVNNDYKYIMLDFKDSNDLIRTYKKYPFIPSSSDNRLEEIINIQSCALARRLIQLSYPKCVIGMSGGLDSTLAFLVTVRALKKLNRSMSDIIGVTMPGFGTTDRTYNNAVNLIKKYKATFKEISIKNAALLHMKDINLPNNDRSVVYENIQARERTQILMDISNMCNGIVIGTGDLSEAALGFCTYNGDHMSMYAVNQSIPKTLVRNLVEFCASETTDNKIKEIIYDILDTPISPELLPPDQFGNILQKTETKIGPYVLHDFFLYHFLRYGDSFEKILYIAKKTFKADFSCEEIINWLKVFIKRFFSQQFKRNCMPDSIKVGTISLSPRGDLRLPSDISFDSFLENLK